MVLLAAAAVLVRALVVASSPAVGVDQLGVVVLPRRRERDVDRARILFLSPCSSPRFAVTDTIPS